MGDFLDEEYLTWLYGQVAAVKLKNPARTYWNLLRQLYTKEFVWLIPNDDNRVEDGQSLRYEFVDTQKIENPDPCWMEMGCSMLEMLIALSRRLAFEAEGEPSTWFWHLIETIDLRQYNDKNFNNRARRKINDTLDTVIWRTYSPDGRGGLFPLQDAKEDQREVEIWYQLSAYLVELL